MLLSPRLPIMMFMTTTTDTSQPTPPLPPPPAPRPRLSRSRSDRHVAGVCGGLGRYFDIDSIIVRIVVFTLALFGAGLLIYAIAWAFIPDDGQPESIAMTARRGGRPSREVVFVALILFTGILGLTDDWGSDGDGDLVWLCLPLLIIGFFWWRREDKHNSSQYGPVGPPPAWPSQSEHPGQAPAAPPAPSEFWAATATAPASLASSGPYGYPAAETRWGQQAVGVYQPRPPRQRSHLALFTITALLIGAGIAALLDGNGTAVSLQGLLAGALVIVGAGLVIGGWYGRSRGLIVLALLLTTLVTTVSAIDVPWRGQTGELRWKATSAADLASSYDLKAGEAVLDLRSLELGETARTVDLNVGFGGVDILVPEDVVVRVAGHMTFGGLEFFGVKHEGFDIDVDTAEPGTPQLTINFQLGLGEIKVRREAS